MNQALLGASLPFAIALVIYLLKGRRVSLRMLLAAPIAMLCCALWAVVPDLPLAFGNGELYNRLSHDPRMDWFFWHYSIDKIEIESFLYVPGFVLLLVSLLYAAWREVRLREET